MWILDEQDNIWQKEKIPFKISLAKNLKNGSFPAYVQEMKLI